MTTLPILASDVAVERALDAIGLDESDLRLNASRRRRPSAWMIAGAVAVLIVAALISAAAVDRDGGSDLSGVVASVGRGLVSLRWQFTSIVVVLAGLHYVATAIAARTAAGIPLPLGETLLVQLAAAAANRLTPAGIGASTVTVRYFTRRGMKLPAALGAVAGLSVLGAVADLIVLTVLVLAGRWLGLSGGPHEIALLASHVTSLVTPLRSMWLWLAVGAVAGFVGLFWMRARRRGHSRGWRQFWIPIGQLARRPRRLGLLLGASGATTLILGFAFVASTEMIPGPRPVASLGALLIAFMIGAAAGSAVPVPAGLGSTEAALVAILVDLHVPAGHAVQDVLVFRVLTFWLPAVVGVLATRRLTRHNAL